MLVRTLVFSTSSFARSVELNFKSKYTCPFALFWHLSSPVELFILLLLNYLYSDSSINKAIFIA